MTDFDIFTNRVPWTLLTDDEREQFMAHEGPLIRYNYAKVDWTTISDDYKTRTATIYRAAPKKPEIPWEHIAPRWNAWTIDKSERSYLYERLPGIDSSCWIMLEGDCTSADCLAIDTTGIDWRDSLVVRPGYEADNA